MSTYLRPTLAQRWGLNTDISIPIAGGAGDNAVGLGVMSAGQGFVSLGTSGVVFVTAAAQDHAILLPDNPTVHTFCHALPHSWHTMSVMLSCAASVDWAAKVLRYEGATALLNVADSVLQNASQRDPSPLFLPYLAGERSPHNNAHAAGVWFGLKAHHEAQHLAYAVLEGVCFGLCDGWFSLLAVARPERMAVVGGLSQSDTCVQLLADVLNTPLAQVDGGRAGAALGAARLAFLADGGVIAQVCSPPVELARFWPVVNNHAALHARYTKFRALYLALEPHF